MVWRLTDDPTLFPDPHYGDEDGLIAIGGDLSPERLANAYCNGIFRGMDSRNVTTYYGGAHSTGSSSSRKRFT